MKTIEEARSDLARAQKAADDAAARARTVLNDPCAQPQEVGTAMREANRLALVAATASTEFAKALGAAIRGDAPVLAAIAFVVVGFFLA